MVHRQLKEKLESLDLSKMDGLEWDEQRAWTRLNSQLRTSESKSVISWKYMLAACLGMLITLMSGYLLYKYSFSMGSTDEIVNEKPVKERPQQREEVENKYGLAILSESNNEYEKVISANNMVPIVTDEQKISTVLDEVEGNAIENSDIREEAIREEELEQQLISDEMAKPNEQHVIQKKEKLVEEKFTATTGLDNVILSSVPVEQKKSKFTIKFFQKRKHRKNSSEVNMPTLTLYASK